MPCIDCRETQGYVVRDLARGGRGFIPCPKCAKENLTVEEAEKGKRQQRLGGRLFIGVFILGVFVGIGACQLWH